MTAFESRGIEFLNRSRSSSFADEQFERSCNRCCSMGIRIECDRCAIRATHEHIIKVLSAGANPVPRFV